MQDNVTNAGNEVTTVLAPLGDNEAEATSQTASWLYAGPLSRAIAAAIAFANLAGQSPTNDCSGCRCVTGDASGSVPDDSHERPIPSGDDLPGF